MIRLTQSSNSVGASPSLSSGPRVVRIFALVILLSGAALYESAHVSAITASEVWVHLRTGTWMLDNHAIPRTGLFSQYSNLAWHDSTWAFDLILGLGYRLFGLRALPILLMLLKAGLALVTFRLARSAGADFWRAIALSALAQYIIAAIFPLPYVVSMLFFAVEVRWLLASRRSGSMKRLYWLPVLFLVWANVHAHFLSGLVMLGIYVVSLFIEQGLRSAGTKFLSADIVPLPIARVSLIAGASLLAAVLTPYGFRLLAASFDTLYNDAAFQFFTEMSALHFRRPQEYLLMLLVMSAFLALGRRRSLAVFELLMLLAVTALAFRVQRDLWLAVLLAIAVVGQGFAASPADDSKQDGGVPAWEWGSVAGAMAALLIVAALRLPDQDALTATIRRDYPVKACDYILANKLPPPLFNTYPWGSFLIWYSPQYPVVVDSRVELYGDKILTESFDIVGGKERLEEHPIVARAGTLLLERNSSMARALVNLPGLKAQYRLVYSDDLASVFVPQAAGSKP